jgi:hypothetical protein
MVVSFKDAEGNAIFLERMSEGESDNAGTDDQGFAGTLGHALLHASVWW